ncbi:MAG TPA: hypothetical protein VM120_04785 [Bryobacteraceae bacterium]|nr:hypothetical protein [Bryobacteraceae bacterium]
MKPFAMLLLFALPLSPAPSRYDRLPAAKKIELIEQGKIPAGTQMIFGEKELNAFLLKKAQEVVPEGLEQPRVEITDGRATGYAIVDFVKMRHAKGQDLGWLLTKLVSGEHPVKVVGRIESSNGNARVDLERVELGDTAIKGRALDMLIRTFVSPLYPQARIGEEFELGYNMDRIELLPGAARVVMAPRKGRS